MPGDGTAEQAIERLERSQAQAIASPHTPQLSKRSPPLSGRSKTTTHDREAIIARIRYAKDTEGKSYQQNADGLNAEGIATFSGRGTWEKGNVGRFYKGKAD